MSTERVLNEKEIAKLEDVYNKYGRLMYLEAQKILIDAESTDDAVQQSMLKLGENIDKFDENDVARTRNFAVTICRNIAIDIYNQRKKTSPSSDVIENMETDESENIQTSIGPVEILITKETINEVEKAIDRLEPIYRDVIVLERTGNSKEDIARMLNISYENVKKRSLRARSKIAEILKKEGIIR